MCNVHGVFPQSNRRQKIESQLKTKKQEAARWSRELSLLEKKVREHEVEMSKRRPLYIKAKERTSHVLKRLEASRYMYFNSCYRMNSLLYTRTFCIQQLQTYT